MTTGIAVMAKAPRAGACKTRLIPMLTPQQAALMGAAFLGDVMENLAAAARHRAIVPYVAFSPAGTEAAFSGIVPPGTRMLLADGAPACPAGVAGFGRSLLHAVRGVLAQGHGSACVLNADSPNLPTSRLMEAARILARDEDRVVLGPAEDGGYYLLGMKQAHAGLFADIDWSTDRVAAQTRARAAALGLPVIELLPWYDVDEPATLRRLLRELGQPGRFAAPHTASCVARLGLSADEAEHSAIQAYAERDVGATLAGAVECP